MQNIKQCQSYADWIFEIKTTYDKTEKPEIKEKNGVLTVNAVKKSEGAIIGLEDTSAQITIVVPTDQELSELTIEGNNSAIDINEVSIKKSEYYDTRWLGIIQ